MGRQQTGKILEDVANQRDARKVADETTDAGVKRKAVAEKRNVEKAVTDGAPTIKPGEKLRDYKARVKAHFDKQ